MWNITLKIDYIFDKTLQSNIPLLIENILDTKEYWSNILLLLKLCTEFVVKTRKVVLTLKETYLCNSFYTGFYNIHDSHATNYKIMTLYYTLKCGCKIVEKRWLLEIL